MHKNRHAQQVALRFREMVEEAGESLTDARYDELALLIESAIDTVLVDRLERIADELDAMAHRVRHDAESFETETG